MKKKVIAVLVILMFISGTAFAQEQASQNAVILDLGPTLFGAAVGAVFRMVGDEAGGDGFGFGVSGQYERMLFNNISVAGKFGYLGFGLGIDDISMGMKSFTLEAHGRYRPFGNVFFVGAMLGYGNLSFEVSEGSTEESLRGHYMNAGAKVGWGTNFNRPMGLTFEVSLGYYFAFRLGGNDNYNNLIEEFPEIDETLAFLEKVIFIGGPRLTLGAGWRF